MGLTHCLLLLLIGYVTSIEHDLGGERLYGTCPGPDGKGPCEHICILSSNGYEMCECHTGWYTDPHDRTKCIQRECLIPFLSRGSVVSSTPDVWTWGIYGLHHCNDPRDYLIGNDVRHCYIDVATMTMPRWTGTDPACLDICGQSYVAPTDFNPKEQPRLLPLGMGDELCYQKGGCFMDNNCYSAMSDGGYVRYGEKAQSSYILKSLIGQHAHSCAYHCKYREPGCVTFSIERQEHDVEQNVTDTWCHLLSAKRQLARDGASTSNKHGLYHHIQPTVQEDRMEELENTVADAVYVGCYEESLPYTVISQDILMTRPKCIDTCRLQGYQYAGLKMGVTCACGVGTVGLQTPSDKCMVRCQGAKATYCGGRQATDVYKVSLERRFAGCFQENSLSREFSQRVGSISNPLDCISLCKKKDKAFAAVTMATECYCGDTFGAYGRANRTACDLNTAGLSSGGEQANAVYFTETAHDMSRDSLPRTTSHLYDVANRVTGLTTSLFTDFAALKSFVSKRLVVYASEGIYTAYEREDMLQQYDQCGEIEQITDLNEMGSDVTLRFMFIRLSDIYRYIGTQARRVYVYAQTIYVDTDRHTEYPFALLLRAREIIVDRSKVYTIGVASDVPELELANWNEIGKSGPGDEIVHLRQSYLCARMLMDSGEKRDLAVSWKIIDDIITSPPAGTEEKQFISTVRSFASRMSGVVRDDVHIVPHYSLSRLADILYTYETQLGVYNDNWKNLQKQMTDDKQRVEYALEMNSIYAETAYKDAQEAYANAMMTLKANQATYDALYEHYSEARRDMERAEYTLKREIDEAQKKNILSGLWSFCVGLVDMARGIYTQDTETAIGGARSAFEGLASIDLTIVAIADIVDNIEELVKVSRDVMKELDNQLDDFDDEPYVYNIDQIVMMHTQVIEWRNLEQVVTGQILENEELKAIDTSVDYAMTILNLINWGEALTKTMIERAESMREAMQMRLLMDSKKSQLDRVEEVIEAASSDAAARRHLQVTMMEQTFEVRLLMNEALIEFCEAYFFENLEECPSSSKPNFQGDLDELLIRTAYARQNQLFFNFNPSSMAREAVFTDEIPADECKDYSKCPVKSLKDNGHFYVTIDPYHSEFYDLNGVRVSELEVSIIGADLYDVQGNPHLKFFVDASGQFEGRSADQVYNFLLKPVTKVFERNLIDGRITLRADIYRDYRTAVAYFTPYATWHFKVDERRSANIDFSKVTAIHLRVHGYHTLSYRRIQRELRLLLPPN